MAKTNAIVLDSWAILAYFQDEPAAEALANMIADAQEESIPLLMSVVNIGEVWYTIARRRSAADAEAAIGSLQEIGIEFIDADWDLTRTASRYKAKGNISYADCFAAALAKLRGAILVTGDREFKQLEKEIAINWL